MRTILFLVSNMFGGGAQRVLSRLADAFVQTDRVIILTSPTPESYPLSDKVEVRYLEELGYWPNPKWGRPGVAFYHLKRVLHFVRQVTRLKKQEKVDVTLSMLRLPNLLNALSGGGGYKVMSERNNPRKKGRFYYYNSSFSYHFADRVVFQTETVRDMFPRSVRRKGVVIPNPISVPCLAGEAEKKIVTLGRLHPQKNHAMLIRAFASFSQTHPGYSLHIYGKDIDGLNLQAYVKKLSLEDKVFLEGFHDDVHERIADAEQFVLSSDYEGTPNALLEAMMMGLPCISTEFQGARELFGERRDACLLTPIGDESSLAAAMSRLADDPDLRVSLSENGRRFARSFSLDKTVPLWYEALFGDNHALKGSYSPAFVFVFSFLAKINNRISKAFTTLRVMSMVKRSSRESDAEALGKFRELIPDLSSYYSGAWEYQLRVRALARGCKTLGAYYRFVEENPGELADLKGRVTYAGSHFFRDNIWDELKRQGESAWKDRSGPVRIWCAGCASGKEVYSVLMTLLDFMPAERIELFATDYNRDLIGLCKEGAYPLVTINEIPRRYRHYTEKCPGPEKGKTDIANRFRFRFCSELRDLVNTGYLNLITDDYPQSLDLILCRNVVKFFEKDIREQVQGKLAASLSPGGLLVVSSELDSEGIENPGSLSLKQVGSTCMYLKAAEG